MASSCEFTLTPASQSRSTLFWIPYEIRREIFCLVLLSHPDPQPSRQYYPLSAYARPDHKSREVTDARLLGTCQSIYAETWSLPFQLRRHTQWLAEMNFMPPDQKIWLDWPMLARQAQRMENKRLRNGEKPVIMDSLQVFISQRCIEHGYLEQFLSTPHLHPRTLTITIRHTEWLPCVHLVLESSWIAGICQLLSPHTQQIHLELESTVPLKQDIDWMVEAIQEHWSFQRQGGEPLYTDTSDVSSKAMWWSRVLPSPSRVNPFERYEDPKEPNIYKATVLFQTQKAIESSGGAVHPQALANVAPLPSVPDVTLYTEVNREGIPSILNAMDYRGHINPHYILDGEHYDKRPYIPKEVPMVTHPRFNRDSAVNALTSYYEVVARAHYGNTDVLMYPPSEGWSYLRPSATEAKSEDAVDFLRRIPYFKRSVFIGPCARSMEPFYQDPGDSEDAKDVDEGGLPRFDRPGPDIIELCAPTDRMGTGAMRLDVRRGTVWWPSPISGGHVAPHTGVMPNVENSPDDPKFDPPWDHQSRWAATYTVEHFFAMCTEQWRRMNWMPQLELEAPLEGCVKCLIKDQRPKGDPGSKNMLRMRILAEAGWPGVDGVGGEGWDFERAKRVMQEQSEPLLRIVRY